MKKFIEVCCYGTISKWESRRMAIEFYRDGVDCCEGSERERYMNIYLDLVDCKDICVDENLETDKVSAYKYAKANNRYLHFDNPNDTRDFGGKLWDIIEK